MTFMQDNAPCYKSKVVTAFFESEDITMLDWPPQSPDLNPIENLWAIIKVRRQNKFGFTKSRDELINLIFDIWNEVDIELREKLAGSIVKRLDACLRSGGKPTKY